LSNGSVHSGLNILDYAVVAAYLLLVVGIGWYYSRRQTDLNEYFLGGRRMNWLVVGLSMFATLISTISYLTTPGEILRHGPGVIWSFAAGIIAFFIVSFLIIPRIMRYAIVSGYQLLERQFGMGIRQTAAFFFVLVRISWVGLIVYTCSAALNSMTGWPIMYILIALGSITTFYTVLGGVEAVIITDAIQAIILYGGAILVVVYAMVSAGSLVGWWPDFSNPVLQSLNWDEVKLWPSSLSDRITTSTIILHYTIYQVSLACSDQLLIQRFLSTENVKAARNSYLVSTIAGISLGFLLIGTGYALVSFFVNNLNLVPPLQTLLPNASPELLAKAAAMGDVERQVFTLTQAGDKIFPWFIAHILPPGISGLLMAALFSAAMSSISSGINSISTVLMVDFKKVFATGLKTHAEQVSRARIIGIFVGILAILVSILDGNLRGNFMDIAQKSDRFLVAPMMGLFLMAFFMKRTNRQGAWAQVVVTFLVAFYVTFYQELNALLFHRDVYISFTWIFPFSLGAGLIVGYAVSLLFPPPPDALAQGEAGEGALVEREGHP